MSQRVTKGARLIDLLGLTLVLVGAAAYGWAWVGLRGMDGFEPAQGAPMFAALARAERLDTISHVGAWLMVAGVVVALISAIMWQVVKTRSH